jgi:hypothetical protein
MSNDIKIRCSSLPLAMICPGSVRRDDGEIQVDPVNDAADVGTAVHFGLAKIVMGESPDVAMEATIERFQSVDVEELRPLFWAGVRAWKQISEWMPEARAEIDIARGRLTGHIDFFSKLDGATKAALCDWKSGRKDYICKAQLFGYCWLAFDLFPELEEITAHAVWLRTGEIESYTANRARAAEWYAVDVGAVSEWDGVYRPGDHCTYCRRNHACPAQTALVRRDVAIFADGVAQDLATMPDADFVAFHRKIKGLGTRIEAAVKAARSEVERRGGDVDGGDGTHLFFKDESGPRKVDAMRAWPVLQSNLDDAELSPAIKVSIAKVEKAVAAKAPKGKGAAAKRALIEALEAVDAISQTTVTKLHDERKK